MCSARVLTGSCGLQRQGTNVDCYVSMLLDDAALESKDQSVDNQRDFDIRWTANSLYAGKFSILAPS